MAAGGCLILSRSSWAGLSSTSQALVGPWQHVVTGGVTGHTAFWAPLALPPHTRVCHVGDMQRFTHVRP